MKITAKHVAKINELLDHGLSHGLGEQAPGQMCVEAAICYALGLPHGDDPKCVMPALRSLKIALNDNPRWTSNKARAEGLRRLAIAQLGSDELDERDFVTRLARMTIQTMVPSALRSAAAYAADAAAYAADAAYAAGESVLVTYAENVVQILIEMKAPGCQWLKEAA